MSHYYRRRSQFSESELAPARANIFQKSNNAPRHESPATVAENNDVGRDALSNHAQNIQTKLKVGKANDPMETEADAVADRVMSMPASATRGTNAQGQTHGDSLNNKPQIQRMEEEDETANPKLIQRMEEEEETASPKLIQRMEEEEETASPKLIQRMEEEEETASPKPSGKSSSQGSNMSSGTEAGIRALRRRGGSPLPRTERNFFESRFGRSFGGVRIHTGTQAEGVSRKIKARAFALGRDIVFGKGEYKPGTYEGRKLMAHELTHTVQQTGGPAARRNIIKE